SAAAPDFCRPIVVPGEDRIIRQTVIERGPSTTETHAQAEQHQVEDHKLELTIAPAAKSYSLFVGGQVRPEMHVAVGAAVRLGPVWLEAMAVPRMAAPLRSEVIVGLRLDL